MSAPAADSCTSVAARLRRVSSCFALTTQQMDALR